MKGEARWAKRVVRDAASNGRILWQAFILVTLDIAVAHPQLSSRL